MKRKVQVIQAVCNRCGKEGDTGAPNGRDEWGEMEVSYSGQFGSRTWSGDAGGISYKEDKQWLCMDCGKEFLDFMHGKPTVGVEPAHDPL